MRYCLKCGDRLGREHVCDEASLSAMRRNPSLRNLMNPDGTARFGVPIVLGNGEEEREDRSRAQ